MSILVFFLLFANKSLEEIEKQYLLNSFKALNIREGELRYEKKWATDTIFRLKRIENLLDNPLSLPTYVDSACQVLKDCVRGRPDKSGFPLRSNPQEQWKGFSLLGLSFELSKELGITTIDTQKLKKEIAKCEEGAPDTTEVPSIFAPLVASFKLAEKYLKDGIKELSQEELDKILMLAPLLWGDDSLDAGLKGALHREFNIPVDTSLKVDMDTVLELSKRIDRERLMRASALVIIGFEITKEGLKNVDFTSMKPLKIHGVKGEILFHKSTQFGDFVIGGLGDNIYLNDFAVIIDPGGDDHYKGRAGSIGVLGAPFSIVIDIKGDDIYSSSKLFNFGGAIFGTSILWDKEGDDTYRSSHYSLGAGLFGTGILVDSCGSDIYQGGYFTQGAANFGIGILLDYKGADTYRAYRYAQAMGGTFGYGLLADFEGADLYYSGGKYLNYPLLPDDYSSLSQGFAIGVRPDASGGIGFLYDGSGSDVYDGGTYSQGVSYWYSLGMLVDEGGNDRYNAVEYAQGAGIHLSLGALIDREGDDHYFSRFGPAQGAAHDLSVGFLIDKKGDDTYCVSGGQGIGIANAVGIFIDSDGNDTYMTTEKGMGQGGGREARGFPSSGVFLDLKGKDWYGKMSPAEDTTSWVQGKYGAGIDLSAERVVKEEPPEEEIEEELEGKSIEELWPVACLWEVGPATKKARLARKMLVEKGDSALDYIFPNKMNTKSGLVLRAIRDISDSLQLQASPRLSRCLRDKKGRIRANAIWVLGEIKDSSAVDSLLLALKNPENRARWALRALGEIGDKRVVPRIIPYLKAEEETDRIYACYALQKLKDTRAIPQLIIALSDLYFTVRNAAEKAIIETIPIKSGLPVLLESLDGAEEIAKPHIIRAIGLVGEELDTLRKEEISQKLLKYLEHEDSTIRGFTIEALLRVGVQNFEPLQKIVEEHMKKEEDEFVRSRYKSK